jgi:hypothetical protein
MFYATCDRCFKCLECATRDAAIAAGWIPKHADTGAGYGWVCPPCVGQPIIVRRRGRSKSRVGS